MRFVSCSAALAASLFWLSPVAQAVTNLGNLAGYKVQAVGGDTDTGAFPDLTAIAGNSFQGQPITTIGNSPRPGNNGNYVDKFSVITFTLTQTSNVRIDLAWRDLSGYAASAMGQLFTEVDKVVDFSLRDASGAVLPSGAGATYFHAVNLVPDPYGVITIPPAPYKGSTVTTAGRQAQMSQAKLFTSLPPGNYTLTAYGRLMDGGFGTGGGGVDKPKLEVGVITAPATDFVAYQAALVAPLGLGDAVVPNDPNAAWAPAVTASVCPVSYKVTSSKSFTFDASVSLSNATSSTLSAGWTVNGSFDKATLVYITKNAKLVQKTGLKSFTATPLAANAALAAGGTTSFTFSGSKGSVLPTLTSLTLTAGGKTCTAVPAAQ